MGRVVQIGPAIRDTRNQALYEHWLERRGPALVTPRYEIDLAGVRDLLPYVCMFDRDSAGYLTWRYVGTGLAALFDSELIGQLVISRSGLPPHHDRRFLDIAGAVAGQPCGAVILCSGLRGGGRALEMEQLYLPLLDASGAATILLAHVALLGIQTAAPAGDELSLSLHRSGPISDVTIGAFACFDIGAGVPGGKRPIV